jgi:hypothetical protein
VGTQGAFDNRAKTGPFIGGSPLDLSQKLVVDVESRSHTEKHNP